MAYRTHECVTCKCSHDAAFWYYTFPDDMRKYLCGSKYHHLQSTEKTQWLPLEQPY
jgi:hypothetical protein